MNQGKTDENMREMVRAAGRIVFEPFFSEQDKFNAIEYLRNNPSEESIEILKRVLEYLEGPPPSFGVDDQPVPLPAGLSASAAKALARISHPEGLPYIITMLDAENANQTFRECAALALGGLSNVKVIRALVENLDDTNPQVRLAVTQSLRESLQELRAKLVTVNPARTGINDLNKAIDQLTSLLGSDSPGSAGSPSASSPRLMIRHFLSSSALELVNEGLKDLRKSDAFFIGLNLLGEEAPANIVNTLAALLKSKTRHEKEYRAIAKALMRSNNPHVRKIANQIVDEENLWDTFSSIFMWRKRKNLNARKQAAQSILVDSKLVKRFKPPGQA